MEETELKNKTESKYTLITISVEKEVINNIRKYNLNASRICNKALKDWATVVDTKIYSSLFKTEKLKTKEVKQ